MGDEVLPDYRCRTLENAKKIGDGGQVDLSLTPDCCLASNNRARTSSLLSSPQGIVLALGDQAIKLSVIHRVEKIAAAVFESSLASILEDPRIITIKSTYAVEASLLELMGG